MERNKINIFIKGRILKMTLIGIILILIGIAGIGMGGMMFGDIGIACIVGGLSALFSGIGFMIANKKIKKLM